MAVKYKNFLIESEGIIKYLEKQKLKYWVTLKFPMFLRSENYDIKYLNTNIFIPFMNKLAQISKDNNLFILGVIEDYYLKKGFHAHVLISVNKQEFIIRQAWIEALKELCFIMTKNKELSEELINKANQEIILMSSVNLLLTKEPYDVKVNYMFKNFGLNKGHGYFCNKTDLDLINNIETVKYKEFLKLNLNKGLSFVIFIYALSDLFNIALPYNFILEVIKEKEDFINFICEQIDEYLVEKYDFLFSNDASSDNFRLLLEQIAIEISCSELFIILKPNFSFKKKIDITDDLKSDLKKYKKKNSSLNYYDYIVKTLDIGIKKYKEECNNWLKIKNIQHVESKFNIWLYNLATGEDYFFDIIHHSVTWILVTSCSSLNKPFSQEYIVKELKKIWEFYFNTFTKTVKIDLDFKDYYILLKLILKSIEKKLKIKNLLVNVNILNKKDNIKTYMIWSTLKSRYIKEKLSKIFERVSDITQDITLLDLKKIKSYKILKGTMYIPPKNWVITNKNLDNNYTGGYILNKVFKFSAFLHHDESWLGKFEPENLEEFVETLNWYQQQYYYLNLETYNTSTGEIVKLDSNISSKVRGKRKYTEKEMEEIRENYKKEWIRKGKKRKIYHIIYIDGRGRVYIGGVYSYLNDKEIRKRIEKEGGKIVWKDANTSCYQIATMIFGIEEMYKKYFVEEKKEEIYDYYLEVVKKYWKGGEEGKKRKAVKRAVMTQIYGAVKMTLEKYLRKGIEEQGIEEEEEEEEEVREGKMGVFLEEIKNEEMNKRRMILEKKIGNILWGKAGRNIHIKKEDIEVRKIMEVKAMGRLMQSIYCEKNKEKHVIRMFKKRGVIKYIEYDKDYIDIYKTKQAFFVNTVHFIDSGIAYNIIKEFKEKGKGIFCVHDCFGVLEKEEKEIEKVYIKVFKGGEQEIRLENYYKNILESKKKEIKGIRRKEREEIEEEWKKIVKESQERKEKWQVEKNSNLLKNE